MRNKTVHSAAITQVPMKKIQTLALFAVVVILAVAVFSPSAVGAEQRPIEFADIMAWRFMTSWSVSDDGAWFGYHIGPTEGDGDVILRQTHGEKQYKFGAGEVS